MSFLLSILRKKTNTPSKTGEVGNHMKSREGTPMERIERALGNRLRSDDAERSDLPVALRHDDVLPVSGSVLIAERRVVSREQVDKALDKALRL